eukprot:1866745-Pleurochrysis_carterae.AAC.3
MCWIPLPWWMSQSMTSTRLAPRADRACAAATATELNTQKPIAACASAWWPGGRTTASPLRMSPRITDSVNSSSEPHARRAACTRHRRRRKRESGKKVKGGKGGTVEETGTNGTQGLQSQTGASTEAKRGNTSRRNKRARVRCVGRRCVT